MNHKKELLRSLWGKKELSVLLPEAGCRSLHRFESFPDCYVACHLKEPIDMDTWFARECQGMDWKDKLKQTVQTMEFLEQLSEDDHLDASWLPNDNDQDSVIYGFRVQGLGL